MKRNITLGTSSIDCHEFTTLLLMKRIRLSSGRLPTARHEFRKKNELAFALVRFYDWIASLRLNLSLSLLYWRGCFCSAPWVFWLRWHAFLLIRELLLTWTARCVISTLMEADCIVSCFCKAEVVIIPRHGYAYESSRSFFAIIDCLSFSAYCGIS